MNLVSLGLDGLLALLLVTALAVGVRLNAKLKTLRESQAGFVKAVADLDAAASKAGAGLSDLRAATQEAHDALLDRIETARTLAARLDRAVEEAQSAAERAESVGRRASERPAALDAPPRARPRLVEPAPTPDGDAETVLRLIESAREEAGRGAERPGALLGALRAPPLAPAGGGDRLAAFVARRREAQVRGGSVA
jgi:hypothetical protein